MIFSIQRFVEDYFSRRTWVDPEYFAIEVANIYIKKRHIDGDAAFRTAIERAGTSFFRKNKIKNKKDFSLELTKELDRKFLKKKLSAGLSSIGEFAANLAQEQQATTKSKRRTLRGLLETFSHAVSSRAVDSFWISRRSGRLLPRPEIIGHDLLTVFMQGVLDGKGTVLKEAQSGIGYIDLVVLLSRVPHLVEIKVIKKGLTGISQLESYMRSESRNEGWLVLFDARPPHTRADIPDKFSTSAGVVHSIVVDINPTPPSRVWR